METIIQPAPNTTSRYRLDRCVTEAPAMNPTDVDTKLVPMLLRLPRDLRQRIREQAITEDRTQAQVVRRALKAYLDRSD